MQKSILESCVKKSYLLIFRLNPFSGKNYKNKIFNIFSFSPVTSRMSGIPSPTCQSSKSSSNATTAATRPVPRSPWTSQRSWTTGPNRDRTCLSRTKRSLSVSVPPMVGSVSQNSLSTSLRNSSYSWPAPTERLKRPSPWSQKSQVREKNIYLSFPHNYFLITFQKTFKTI